MKRMTKCMALLLALALCLSAAAWAAEDPDTAAVAAEDLFSDRDYDGSYEDCVTVTLADGASAADGAGVTIAGDVVTITEAGTYRLTGTLTDGQLVVAAAEDEKVQLVLDNASVTCAGGAALLVESGDKVFLTLAEGSQNALVSTGEFAGDDGVDGAVFSRSDLTLNGAGALTVESETGHGLVCKDDLKITGGVYTVTAARDGVNANDSIRIAGGEITLQSGSDGLQASQDDPAEGFIYITGGTLVIDCENDALDASSTLTVEGGDLTLTAGGGAGNGPEHTDFWGMPNFGGFASENAWEEAETDTTGSDSHKGLKAGTAITVTGGTLRLDTADDGIHADGDVTITGGSLTIASGDDGIHADSALTVSGGILDLDAYEGLEALTIRISGGDLTLLTEDDGINASGGTGSTLTVSGGTLRIHSDGDSLDANGSLYVTGGDIQITGPSGSGNGILDYDYAGAITGGTVMAAGVAGMQINFDRNSTQGSILYTLSAAQSAGSVVTLTDSTGAVIAEYTPEESYQVILISSPAIVSGETYTLTAGTETAVIQMTSLLYGSGFGFGGASGGPGWASGGASGEFAGRGF